MESVVVTTNTVPDGWACPLCGEQDLRYLRYDLAENELECANCLTRYAP